jgi:GTPase
MPDNETNNIVLDILYIAKENKLIPEPDKSGNIEYKLRLDKKDFKKQDNMISQIVWRMNEGKNQCGRYEAHYILGIHDDGKFSDLSESVLNNTTNIFRGMVKRAGAKIVSEKTYVFPGNKMITHVVVHRDNKERHILEANVMIVGATGSCKSSLMGRLTYGQKDDGNGFTRKLVLRHTHEKISGNTSSTKYDTIGFMGSNIMNYSVGIEFNMENIYNSSDRLVNLIDLPGDLRYIKTILFAVSSVKPDNIIVCIPWRTEIDPDPVQYIERNAGMYRLIVRICIVYAVQPIIVLTKSDLVHDVDPAIKSQFVSNILKIFNEWARLDHLDQGDQGDQGDHPENHGSMALLSANPHNSVISIDFYKSPPIEVSGITDQGSDELINTLQGIAAIRPEKTNHDTLFVVNDSFNIPDTGIIFHGTVLYGTVELNQTVDVLCHGIIMKQKIKSLHRKTLDVELLRTRESGSLTFYGKNDKLLDKTMMIIGPSWERHIVTKTRVVSQFNDIKLKPQQYLLFVNNNIITVLLFQTNDNLIFEVQCTCNTNFLLNTTIGILKDEQQNYFFVKFIDAFL